MPEDLRLYPQDIKEIAANINQELLAVCQIILVSLKKRRPIPQSLVIELQEAIQKPQAIAELIQANDIYERYIVVGEVMAKINDEAVYDLLRGIVTAICLTMTENESVALIEQINAQEIVSQYEHRVEYGKVIRKRSERDSGDKPPESGQDSDDGAPESI